MAGRPPMPAGGPSGGGNDAAPDAGLTMIELLVVMVILAMLAGLGTVSYDRVRQQPLRARAVAEVKMLGTNLRVGLDSAGLETSRELTGAFWTAQYCIDAGDLRELSRTHECWTRFLRSMQIMQDRGWVDNVDLSRGDPWGSPYLIDENEGEAVVGQWGLNCRRRDQVLSAGPNGIYEHGLGDDIGFYLPRRKFTRDC